MWLWCCVDSFEWWPAQYAGRNSSQQSTRQVIIWTDCMFVINGFARGRRRKQLSNADLWEEFWKAHDVIGPPILLHKVWRSNATETEITAVLVSPLEAYSKEAADKLAARGALHFPWSVSRRPAAQTSVQTRLVEINLLHLQNRTKTVCAKANAPERRAKFDPAEAMCQLNRIGHDFSRMQVGKGRFTCKCRLCFLRGERSFLFCHFAQRCSSACSRLHSHT